MAYLSSGASQTISAKQYRHCGSKAFPDGVFARTSNSDMRPLWDFGINNRVSKHQLNLWTIAGVKKKEMVNKTVAKVMGAAEKAMSNNAPESKYDVFVSFRGEDIRHGFLGHLAKAFSQKQINAFVDDKLKRGDDISHSLFEAIEGSFISLIIFSENYASSRWCLEELVKIIDCKEKCGQIVIPVFYGVDPTDVRHQKKSYENALVGHENKYILSKVQKWRQALEKSANLSGIKSLDFRNDAELLEEIINLVLKRLSKYPINTKGFIGIAKPIAHLESLLRQKSKKVRVIGIWGMGGIGKTTIAEEVFNRSCSEYEGCCFLAKVSDELGRHGIAFLKKELFSTLLAEDVKIDSPNGLSNNIQRRIGRMKVLIVLDDVKEEDQLEILFGTLDWFRSDSRIIVTTRDKHVLITNEVDDIYEVGVLNYSEALELFNLNAFKLSHLEREYYELSKKVIDYAKGIPLVLKVFAHLLRGKDKEVWESQLDKLKRLPSKKVHDVMRLSYDDLDRLERKYFLDIACFFNGLRLKVDYMKHLLKDFESDNAVAVGLERLKDKALITISEDNVISMHDILQEMGREVVRQESSEDPGKRSRLWDPDEICDVLKNDKGTDAIRSIRVDLSAIGKLSPRVFDKMTNLQFLDFYGHFLDDYSDLFPQGFKSFPTDLRYLKLDHYPLKSFPKKFSAKNLVILNMYDSRVEKLWCGVQNLVNLKEVKLRLSSLKELPDFSKATNLEVLDLACCNKLTSVHPSIFSLDKLVHLKIALCNSLTTFTGNSNLSSQHYLKLGCCRQLSQSKLETLVLWVPKIESIPSIINDLTRLRKLDIRLCSKLVALPELPSSLETLLVECRSLKTVLFPSTVAEQFKENKKRIEFWKCKNLDELSLINIGLNMKINLVKFACHNLSTPEHDDYVKSSVDYKVMLAGFDYNYNIGSDQGGVYVYPGSSVPDWLEYKTTKDDMIVDLSPPHLSSLLGFVFCFILADDDEYYDIIEMRITTTDVEADGEKDGVDLYIYVKSYYHTESDCVCMIYNQPLSRYLIRIARNQTRGFNINVTATIVIPNFCEEEEQQRREVKLKGFGISPIYPSTYQKLIQQMEEEQRK